MPTRGFEPPHPEGQQILSLSRLPVPPRRHSQHKPSAHPQVGKPWPANRAFTRRALHGRFPLSQGRVGSYPRFCRASSRSQLRPEAIFLRKPAAICLTPSYGVAASGLPGVTRLCRHRCDETKWSKQPPGPLALLPVARSPSRPRHRDRWWALTPPVRPLPGPCWAPAGMLSVAVVVRTRLSPACPHLPFREATLPCYPRTGEQSWESGSSSDQQSLLSGGSLTQLPNIIPRGGACFKYPARVGYPCC